MKLKNYITLFLMGGMAGHVFGKGYIALGLLCVVVIVFYIVYLISNDFKQ
jgi:hypothetical protein